MVEVTPATLNSGVAGSATVLLVSGAEWSALRDATIHLEVFVDGATTYLIENPEDSFFLVVLI